MIDVGDNRKIANEASVGHATFVLLVPRRMRTKESVTAWCEWWEQALANRKTFFEPFENLAKGSYPVKLAVGTEFRHGRDRLDTGKCQTSTSFTKKLTSIFNGRSLKPLSRPIWRFF